jgi:cytochrome b
LKHERHLVWDLPVRLAHWLLVLGIAGSFITHYAGPAWFDWHRRCGYGVLMIVAFRIVWAFAGTPPARFAAFVRGPRAIAAWLRSGSAQSRGHNPLGALNVVAMLVLILAQAVTGLFANDEIASAGPLYGLVSHDLINRLSRFHSANDTWLLVLIGLHLAAVAWYGFVLRQRIVRGMITGDPGSTGSADGATIVDSMLIRALLIVLVLGALLALLLELAPDAAPALF